MLTYVDTINFPIQIPKDFQLNGCRTNMVFEPSPFKNIWCCHVLSGNGSSPIPMDYHHSSPTKTAQTEGIPHFQTPPYGSIAESLSSKNMSTILGIPSGND